MGIKTGIAWTESTLNLAMGCTKVSAECKNCYMFRDMTRFGQDPTKVKLTKAGLDTVIMRKAIKERGNLIFVNSMSDTFHKEISDETLHRWFMMFYEYPEKQFQILTKRPERMLRYFKLQNVPPNCWMGVSVGIKDSIKRIEMLKLLKAKIKFISFEPLIEDLGELDLTGIQWAIIGGESDEKNPRLMNPDWAENIIKQCRRDEVAIFFKQMGGKGKGGAGGSLLNGRELKEYPILTM